MIVLTCLSAVAVFGSPAALSNGAASIRGRTMGRPLRNLRYGINRPNMIRKASKDDIPDVLRDAAEQVSSKADEIFQGTDQAASQAKNKASSKADQLLQQKNEGLGDVGINTAPFQPENPENSAIGTTGGTSPTGKFWDPVGFTKGATPNKLKRFRESEITHGRVGMLGALGWLVQEKFSPLFGGDHTPAAVNQFEEIQSRAPYFWYPVLLGVAIAEIARARIGWEDPATGGLWDLKEDYEPGNIGFDPLNIRPKDPQEYEDLKNKELNNGRLAMLSLAGFMAQELKNGKPIMDNLMDARDAAASA
eukprot:CAMPEP_0184486856 /NCGR_PEP_ID=MMETSP0113_2-20130426/8755_1 /TAXON_ID=91329 /ORGANISM="Norrisiella sphaerica, Strain BC52" /LENGTH=305 /DNA_ID=CAMNT_0026868923 /DNA_START=45 /DNA_END=962 /DNA_ORIENTATION=+